MFNPYTLIAPVVLVFVALALMGIWRLVPQQHSSLWMGLGIGSVGLALGIQSVLPPLLIAPYAIYTALLYLAGSWMFSHSIALEFRTSAHPKWALLISILTWAGLFYYSRVEEQLTTRIYILALGLGLLHLLPLWGVLHRRPTHDWLKACLYWTYCSLCLCILIRPIALLWLDQIASGSLPQSFYWFFTLLALMLFYLTFALLLMGSTVRSRLHTLHTERSLDPLTQLLNRRAFDEHVAMADLQSEDQQPVTVVIADIDHFKQFNDRWGHAMGDRMLQSVAQCLRTNTRHADLLTRFGGEEFVLVLPNTSVADAHHLVLRMQAQLAALPMPAHVNQRLSMSFGIAALQPGDSITDALQIADIELYKAKSDGRDCVRIALEAA